MSAPVPLSIKLSERYLRYSSFTSSDYEPFSENDAIRCADFYESMKNSPDDEVMQKSYEVFKEHLVRQFILMRKNGIECIDGKGEFDYPSSEDLREDMRNGIIVYLPTYSNQGTMSQIEETHPLAENTKVCGVEYCFNDIFRIVHDFFGHGPGHSFSPRGEHEAWNAHRAMLPQEAHAALWCETRGQSSWVNFGRHIREAERFIPPYERPFAPQKVGRPPFDLT